LPVFGPPTCDSSGRLVDSQGDLVTQGVDDIAVRNSLVGLRLVDLRANLLGVGDFEQASLTSTPLPATSTCSAIARREPSMLRPKSAMTCLKAPGAEQAPAPVPLASPEPSSTSFTRLLQNFITCRATVPQNRSLTAFAQSHSFAVKRVSRWFTIEGKS
jgi:hypothetical protein